MAIGPKYRNITTATTTTCKTGSGRLIAIVVNTAVTSGTMTVYDNTTASGTVIATITEPATLLQNHYTIDYKALEFRTGLTVVTTGTQNITVVFSE